MVVTLVEEVKVLLVVGGDLAQEDLLIRNEEKEVSVALKR